MPHAADPNGPATPRRKQAGFQLRRSLTAVALVTGGLAVGAIAAHATGAPTTDPLIYTGYLEQNGAPLSGSHVIEVNLWTSPTSTNTTDRACATLPAGGTSVTGGRFRMPLDPTCTPAVHANPDLYAEVVVDGTALPRTKIGAVPYALEADRASSVDGKGGTATWTVHRSGAISSPTGTFTDVPGLSTSVNLSHAAEVNLLASGTQRQLPSASTECEVTYRVLVDGSPLASVGTGQHIVISTSSAYWSDWTLQDAVALPPGQHTVSVQARLANPTCAVCGDVVNGTVSPTAATDCVLTAQAVYQ